MRIELILTTNEALFCGSCDELQKGPGVVFIGDTEDRPFAVLCATCMDLEEAAIADCVEFTGVAGEG